MTDVQFDEQPYALPVRAAPQKRESYLTRLVISTGFAKDASSAQRALGITAAGIALLAIGIWIWSAHAGTPSRAPLPPDSPYRPH